MAEGEEHSTSAPGSLPQAFDLRHVKRMSREKWSLMRRQSDEAESRELIDREKDKDKDAGSWSAQATSTLMHSFQQKRIAKKRIDSDWRIFRAEDWAHVAMCVNQECGLDGSKDWKTGKQCKYKIFNMKRRYKIEKDLVLQRGGGASDWGWFLKMEALMGEPESGSRYYATAAAADGLDGERRDLGMLLHYHASEKRLHDKQPDSCSSPGSKSTSTTNLDGGCRGCEQQDDEMQTESSPESSIPKRLWNKGKEPPRKKHCGGLSSRPFEAFQTSIEKSMQMMAGQQGEMILLMREMVACKARQTQEVENCEDSTTMEISELRKKIDCVERDLISLKLICDHKKREWNEAMDSYVEKSLFRHEQLNKLLEVKVLV
ncbi:hypothetical protein O6H91_01G072600 [Diphasiastrum complanatum]|uniref:Uncharacterized protein n=1 Tax=Diphasiastrum complanatum TaxID=34168 RepID=A0ACC2ESE3_DIPCM|nr:hypothetical protein O6H91_01G072600 [Diphasiastrum complanatum]